MVRGRGFCSLRQHKISFTEKHREIPDAFFYAIWDKTFCIQNSFLLNENRRKGNNLYQKNIYFR